MKSEPDPVEQFMQLFSATFALCHRRGAPDGLAITPEGRALLGHLLWSGPLPIGELALHMKRAQSVVSESVAVLVSHRLLAKVRDPRDGRRTLVWLTERAQTWLAEEQEPLDRQRLGAALGAMAPEHRRRLLDSMKRLVSAAERHRSATREPKTKQPKTKPARNSPPPRTQEDKEDEP
jgi:DNA-binding MarR family transcriptional regulator